MGDFSSSMGPFSAGLSSERPLGLVLSQWDSPAQGVWGGLLGVALHFSIDGSLGGPQGLLETEPLLEAELFCEAAQAGVWVESSGTFSLSSSWAWVLLLGAGDLLRERFRKGSCAELATGPAIMPRTIRPDFGLVFSPVLFMSTEDSEE